MDFVVYAIPFFLLALLLELLFDHLRGTGYYRANDTINSLSMGLISTTSGLVLIDIGGKVYALVQQTTALPVWQHVSIWQWLLAFLLYDLCYYWFHRISHERKLFWAAHVSHHQSEEYNLSTALRQTSTGFLLSWLFYIPCFFIGMPAEVFVSVASLNLIYQFWVHTRFVPELGLIERVFITPSNHRVHHARNAEYIDKNYGGVFIVWDRLFGTYTPERKDIAVDFGITRGLNSWNPIWANVHVYVGMFRDSFLTRSWRDKIKVWFGATAFVPDDITKGEVIAGTHYDPVIAAWLRNYVILQFLLAVVLGVVLKYQFETMGMINGSVLFAYMVLSLMVLGWLLEGRYWGLELVRLGLAPIIGLVLWGELNSVLIIASLMFIAYIVYRREGFTQQTLTAK
ncbi:sterol desaturase family protein [Oceanicoccus sp. KOV_DT_Chl]|uniref:sterol desaturase family protein n=1 Tax=Oceanicoccus sp. KOV_DT_Chl TaxID=1904639 RepID=UPI000C7989C8|nr:sterol desaturase family protein [Oceanicoccus sp. KOV_DT_Chl]